MIITVERERRLALDRRDLIASLFLMAVSAFACVQSLALGLGALSSPGPGLMLFFSSLALGGLSILLIINNTLRKRPKAKILDLWKGFDWKRAAVAIVALLLYLVLLSRMGNLLTTFVSVLILFGLGRMKPWITLTGAVITTILSHIIFQVLLGVPFP